MFSKGLTITKVRTSHNPVFDPLEKFKREHGLGPKIVIPENLDELVTKFLDQTYTDVFTRKS